ncbi:MAG TPA: head GIN domain-containing protein [Chitinophagaceae bacterium]|nr:head GIN domain-containing protein [Chitinophagaceae bacterium]
MRKIFLYILIMAAYSTGAFSQKTVNDPNVEKRNVSGFHGIDVATGIKLILTEGSVEDVAVSASKIEYRDKIITEVKNGVLKIYYETKFGAINKRKESKDLKAYVSYKSLDKLDVASGAEVEINGVLTSTSFNLQAGTGGLVNGEINVTTLKVNQNTGSKITLSGKVDNLEVEGDTGSKFLGEDLKTTDCSAVASTGARIYITVQKELSAKANTGGNIKYRGDGSIREIKVNTGGSVSKI